MADDTAGWLTPERLRAVADKLASRGGGWVLDTLAGDEPELPDPESAMIDVLVAVYLEVRRLADILAPREEDSGWPG